MATAVKYVDVAVPVSVASAGSALGLVERRIQGDLERFKEFIESRGQETGAWRGSIEHGDRPSRAHGAMR